MCVGADNFVLFCGWKRKTIQAEKSILEYPFFINFIKGFFFKPLSQNAKALQKNCKIS